MTGASCVAGRTAADLLRLLRPNRASARPLIKDNSPPRIEPVQDGPLRPFWSVMVPVFNCSPAYLRETLMSVLVQDPGKAEMQIEVIDNCSTKLDVESLVREIGGDRVGFHRQRHNVGMAGNFNSCIMRASGYWIHILHSDDKVLPGFYARSREALEKHRAVGAAFCRQIFMDAAGRELYQSDPEAEAAGVLDEDFVDRLLLESRIQFPSIVVRRSTYEVVGGFRPNLQACLDWDMWKRIALREPIFYNPAVLACYRVHTGADSSHLTLIGENVVDERRSIEITCGEDVPAQRARLVRSAARRASGIRAARRARQLWNSNSKAAAWGQAMEALRTSFSPPVVARVTYFIARTIVRS
jgi:hypothetical protein